jgi:hypothetical protein
MLAKEARGHRIHPSLQFSGIFRNIVSRYRVRTRREKDRKRSSAFWSASGLYSHVENVVDMT